MTRSPFLAALLSLAVVACDQAPRGEPDVPPPPPVLTGPLTVVLVSLDTVRPGRLGVYGGDPATSPVMDALAAESVVFDQALAPAPWTLPSHMTMLTGLDPVAHGVINDASRLSSNVVTLAESLQAAGFTTGAFTDGGFVSARYGFDQGFDAYDDERNDGPEESNGFPRLMPPALDWLNARGADEDVLLFLHTFDAHTPYDETDPAILERFRQRPVEDGPDDHGLAWVSHLYQQEKVGVSSYPRMGDLLNDYDAGIHEADLWLGRLIDTLKQQNRWENSLVIVTSDHGESFFDHGLHIGHGISVTDSEVHVPLLVKLPGGEASGTHHDELVGLVDITRTALDVAGVQPDESTQGESLVGLVRGQPRRVQHVLGASSNVRSEFLVQNDFKYVTHVGVRPLIIAQRHLGPRTPSMMVPSEGSVDYTLGTGAAQVALSYDMAGDPLGLLDVLPSAEQLYDRNADPREHNDLARDPAHADILDRMRGLYTASRDVSYELHGGFQTEDVEMDAATLRMLEALGYVASGGEAAAPGVSKTMLKWVTDPHVAPDTRELLDADRIVHAVRVAGATPDAGDELKRAGRLYVTWATLHPEYLTRVDWRLVSLQELAATLDIDLPMERWIEAWKQITR